MKSSGVRENLISLLNKAKCESENSRICFGVLIQVPWMDLAIESYTAS